MALRLAISPSFTLSLRKSFLKGGRDDALGLKPIERRDWCFWSASPSTFQGWDVQPCLCFEKSGVCMERSPVKLRNHLVTGAVKTQELEDSTLVDVEESSNGYVLFKFGTTQLYDDPPRFISSSVAQVKSSTYGDADREVIDCTAVVHRIPEESALVNPFHWGGHTASLHRDAIDEHKTRGPFIPRKPVGLPLDFLHSHIPGSLADHLVDKDLEFRHESVMDFLQVSRSNSEMVKLLPANIPLEDVSTQLTDLGTEVVQSMKSSTVRRADKLGKKARSGHKKPTRDLYRSSSFQLYELIFNYPFMDSSKSPLTWKAIPKEKYVELLDVLNQVAVGLAGSGLAIVLFVASRMLCLNATLDSIKFMSLLRGVGLLWLSSAVQKFGGVVRLMAESSGKGRPERKEHLAMLRKEVHSVTFKVFTMLMLSMVRLA